MEIPKGTDVDDFRIPDATLKPGTYLAGLSRITKAKLAEEDTRRARRGLLGIATAVAVAAFRGDEPITIQALGLNIRPTDRLFFLIATGTLVYFAVTWCIHRKNDLLRVQIDGLEWVLRARQDLQERLAAAKKSSQLLEDWAEGLLILSGQSGRVSEQEIVSYVNRLPTVFLEIGEVREYLTRQLNLGDQTGRNLAVSRLQSMIQPWTAKCRGEMLQITQAFGEISSDSSVKTTLGLRRFWEYHVPWVLAAFAFAAYLFTFWIWPWFHTRASPSVYIPWP